ncbi:hypothetical protein DPMN_186738 [Dreissena polymorpha]|uniref:Uncharacterized protein n=1 Tax=Dreissena polymorpha TaxID=45954 RepID=A0A9D4I9U5_DREPO|nr:hypothetical protein DPMN_186738 [Dreissena polymorpha]
MLASCNQYNILLGDKLVKTREKNNLGHYHQLREELQLYRCTSVGFIIAVHNDGLPTNKEELRTNVIELAEDKLGLTVNGIPTGTMGNLTRFELAKDGMATG